MFPLDNWLSYTLACVLVILAPGPDSLLTIGRGLSQGKRAAIAAASASALGIVFHTLTATFGLALLLKTSELAFTLVKVIGAVYLIWLGFNVLCKRSLITVEAAQQQPYTKIMITSFLSAALNPKPSLFVLAFVPQFVDPELGSVTGQMLVYGSWFALLSLIIFALLGVYASGLMRCLHNKPKLLCGLNFGAGGTFIMSGLAIALI